MNDEIEAYSTIGTSPLITFSLSIILLPTAANARLTSGQILSIYPQIVTYHKSAALGDRNMPISGKLSIAATGESPDFAEAVNA